MVTALAVLSLLTTVATVGFNGKGGILGQIKLPISMKPKHYSTAQPPTAYKKTESTRLTRTLSTRRLFPTNALTPLASSSTKQIKLINALTFNSYQKMKMMIFASRSDSQWLMGR